MVFLRHPIDRTGSIYAYERRVPGDAPGPRVARSGGLAEYIRWRLGPEATKIVVDFHVRFLSGARHHEELDKTHLSLAIERINASQIVGTVEHLDESLAYAEAVLEPIFGFIDLSYRAQNVSRARESHLDQRIRAIRSSLGTDLFMELLEKNALDMELHQAATNILMRRIRRTAGFTDLLADFRRRCQARRAA
jgi:hypothetical protein